MNLNKLLSLYILIMYKSIKTGFYVLMYYFCLYNLLHDFLHDLVDDPCVFK